MIHPRTSIRVTSTALIAAGAFAAQLATAATAPAYISDPARSQLEFSGQQAGAAFKGVFKKFTVKAQFDPAQLATSNLDVQIDVNSLDSQDADRDKSMRSAEFFDVAKNPSAHYVTRTITKTAKGYAALGTLTLRGVSRDVPLEFQFTPAAAGATLVGNAALKRLDFGVGQGEWKSTEWVGDAVTIHFSVSLKPAP